MRPTNGILPTHEPPLAYCSDGTLPGGTVDDALLPGRRARVLRTEELGQCVDRGILEKGDERYVSMKILLQAMMNLHDHHRIAAEVEEVIA